MLRLFLALLLLIPQMTQALTLNDLNGLCGNTRIFSTNLTDQDTPATSGVDEKGGYIKMDSNFLWNHNPKSILFVFFHECGHRVNNHTPQFRPANRETVADCYAAKRFVGEYGIASLHRVLDDLTPEYNESWRNDRILRCLR